MAESVKRDQDGGRQKTTKPTLATIAEAVGVSRTTVSNAYNRPSQLTRELRGRIPDSAAVAFLEGLARRCEDAAEALTLIPLPRGEEAADVVREALVDAICVYSLPDNHPAIDGALERRIPLVVVDAPRLQSATFVGVDDRAGARAVAEHLVALGHRRLAVVVPTLVLDGRQGRVDDDRLRSAAYHVDRERLDGLRAGLDAAGVPLQELAIEERSNTQEAGAAAARSLLAETPRPTAVVATTDQLALGVLRGARELGLDVPADLSVAGFDDIPEAGRSEPPLTTVRQPLVEKGRLAGDRLFALLGGSTAVDTVLPVELVARGTTGPAPA